MTINYKEYATALFELCCENNSLDACFADFLVIYDALTENPQYIKLLGSTMLTAKERYNLAEKAFGGVDEILLNFIKFMISKRVVSYLPKCAECFFDMYYSEKNILSAEVISAVELSDEDKNIICQKLIAKTGKTDVLLKTKIDSSIIGGAILRFDGQEIDYSLKSRLFKIKNRLIEK